jgi:hypothetical protein
MDRRDRRGTVMRAGRSSPGATICNAMQRNVDLQADETAALDSESVVAYWQRHDGAVDSIFLERTIILIQDPSLSRVKDHDQCR